MIGLQHGSRKEADVLAGVIALLKDPAACTDKINALSEATQKHSDAVDAHVQAKVEAEGKLSELNQRLVDLDAIEKSIKEQQAQLEALHAKINADSKRLEMERAEHDNARANHEQAVEEHAKKAYALEIYKTRLDHQHAMLAEREAAIVKSERAHVERARKLREIFG